MHRTLTLLAALLALPAVAGQPSVAPPAAMSADAAESALWARTIEQVADSIVTIRVDIARPFDTNWNASVQATGFVVDAERGLILTNRHVVSPGPVVAQAIFRNKEEVELTPIYRDPVHDFGVYRYDPKKLRFNTPRPLPLRPDLATVGREIRVIGNDAGEQLSILQGTLARLDREAPEYGRNQYNDFNTFYIQAASVTSGGSSGSPVIEIEGRVVALNAGGAQGAATSFYLPLGRVVRALDLIRKGEPVSRGTLQTVFQYKSFDELKRLGLTDATETAVRKAFPAGTGMLVVDQIVPGGSGQGALEVGDVLVEVDGALVSEFIPLETVLDGAVGRKVRFTVERGGKRVALEIAPRDLHAITPDEYLEFGGAVVHDLSYQMARHYYRAPGGVFVASPGYALATAGIPRGAMITAVDGVEVADLAAFRKVLERIPDGAEVTFRFGSNELAKRELPTTVTVDRRWFPARFCVRDDRTGLWPCQALAPVPEAAPQAPATVTLAAHADKRADRIARSTVFVNFDMPYQVDGIDGAHYFGTGLVVDAVRGLVVLDRNTVPVLLGDVRLTFGGSLQVPGEVIYLHPLHNLAVVKYDPALLGTTPVASAELATRAAVPDDEVWLFGFRPDQTLATVKRTVKDAEPVDFPLSPTFRFREANLETIELVDGPQEHDGVLTDAKGRVVGLWSSFAYQPGRQVQQVNKGVPAELVQETIDLALGRRTLRSLEVELDVVPLSAARKLGLPEDRAAAVERDDPAKRRVLQVTRLYAGAPAEKLLRNGDLLLTIDGATVNRFRDVERLTQKDAVAIELVRNGKLMRVEVPTVALGLDETTRLVLWSGAMLTRPHRVISVQRGLQRDGVFVGYWSYGSPANRYGLTPGRRIVAVDDQPTPDLDAFLKVVAGKRHRDPVRLKTVAWNGAVEVITLKTDLQYWPTYELARDDAGNWRRIER